MLLLAGVCAIAYPFLAMWLSDRAAGEFTAAYDEAVAQADEEEVHRAWDSAVAYNENLAGDPVHDPFLEGSGMVLGDDYENLLDLDGSGVMGHVSVPKTGMDLPIYHGTSDASLRRGAGHLEGSSLPVGGAGAHAVLTGHSGLVGARLFSDLDKLACGDRFYVTVLGTRMAYEVDEISVVEPDDVSGLRRVDGEDLCTLVTCTPYGVNSHRLLVRGHRAADDAAGEAPDAGTGPAGDDGTERVLDALRIAVGAGAAAVMVIRGCGRRKEVKMRP